MQSDDLFCKLKRFKLLEPSVTLPSFVLMSVIVVSCFFYLDYGYGGAVKEMPRIPGTPERLVRVESRGKRAKGGGEGGGEGGRGGKCDWFDGMWVWDESYPLYDERDCKFLDEGFKCSENGRPDRLYTKWRWQPRNCNLPR